MNNYRLKHLKLDAIGNQEILHDGLLPIITEIETKMAFFRDNALIRTVATRKMWFKISEISLLPWLVSRLNSIENLWRILATKV